MTPKSIPSPPRSPAAVALRFAASGLLVALYFVFYEQILGLFSTIIITATGEDSLAGPKVAAVTLLGILLVAIWWRLIKKDIRFHAPILITYILAIGDAMYGILDNHSSEWLSNLTDGRVTSYSPTFIAILATIAIDMALARFIRCKWPHLSSAYITGISVGILIKSPDLWPFVMCGLISIASKYVLRVRNRHLWNPSNFGVTAMLFLASDRVASLSVQAGNEVWPVLLIWVLGSLILYRLGRLHIPLVFLACFVPLALFRSSVTGNPWRAELGPVTWPMFQLYIFFMITDPATTTKRKWSQCVVVALVAITETVLRLAFRDVHSLYHALFIVGPITNLIEILLTKPKPIANAECTPQPAMAMSGSNSNGYAPNPLQPATVSSPAAK
jgi:hypothetical protein